MRSKKQKSPKVHHLWIAREFDTWLENNRDRFVREPYLFKKIENGVRYRFRGATGKISLHIDPYQFMITVHNGRLFVDIISEFDVALRETKSGKYFCELCVPKYRKYYTCRAALLSAHCFKPLIEWAEEKLRLENILVISGEPRGWSSAEIVDSQGDKIKTENKKYERFRYPVILGS